MNKERRIKNPINVRRSLHGKFKEFLRKDALIISLIHYKMNLTLDSIGPQVLFPGPSYGWRGETTTTGI